MRIVVVGGGVAGVSAALALHDAGFTEITLIEGSPRLGGKIRTLPFAGQPVETGAEGFLVREAGVESAVLAMAKRLGLADELVHPEPAPAALAIDGELHPLPAGTLMGIPADPATLPDLVPVGGDDDDRGAPVLPIGQDVAVGALVRARMGDAVADRLVDPLLGGVYAGRADQLSLAATVPGLYRAAQTETTLARAVKVALAASPRPAGAPVFASVRGGLSRLIEAAAAASGAQVVLGRPVRALTRTDGAWRLTIGSTRAPTEVEADAVILAVPAAPAARLLRGVSRAAADAVRALDYASVVLVTMALPGDTRLPELSGFLVPPAEGYAVKATTFFSAKWANLRGGPVLVRASLGRYSEATLLQRTDASLIATVREELGRIVGGWPDPIAARVNRWGGGLPQYAVGHLDRVGRARAALPASIAVAGAGFDGVGIAACVRSGEQAAQTIRLGD